MSYESTNSITDIQHNRITAKYIDKKVKVSSGFAADFVFFCQIHPDEIQSVALGLYVGGDVIETR